MGIEYSIRAARDDDASAISQVILSALRETNAKDYTPEIIARLEEKFCPKSIKDRMGGRKVFVALVGGRIVGTASLEDEMVRSVFVDPRAQGRGIGKQLMAEVERAAREAGITALTVPSSVSAEQFYAKLGFSTVRDSYYGDERTIIMERRLPPA